MVDDTTDLDGHRGMAGLQATVLRRNDLDVEKDRQAERAQKDERENLFVSEPSRNWPDVVEKARYLLIQFSEGIAAGDTRTQSMIAMVLADFERLRGDGPAQ